MLEFGCCYAPSVYRGIGRKKSGKGACHDPSDDPITELSGGFQALNALTIELDQSMGTGHLAE